MLAYNLKDILSIVPDLKEHIKEANIEESYPLDNKDGCMASYIRYQYLTKVANKLVAPEQAAKLEKAAYLYGILEEAKPFVQRLEKFAAVRRDEQIKQAEKLTKGQQEAFFDGTLTGFVDLTKVASTAQELYGPEASDNIKLYAGDAYFDKEAAIRALSARAYASGKDVFTKIAEILENSVEDSTKLGRAEIADLCSKVTELDKKAGLDIKGFNFYKEALTRNRARIKTAMSVKVCGKNVPYEKIASLGASRIGNYLGSDVGSAITGDPYNDKAVIESLPLDLQRVLQGVLRNV